MVRITNISDRNSKIRNKYITKSIKPNTKQLLKAGILERNKDIRPLRELKYPMNSQITSMIYGILNRHNQAPQQNIGNISNIEANNNQITVFKKKISLNNIEGKKFSINEATNDIREFLSFIRLKNNFFKNDYGNIAQEMKNIVNDPNIIKPQDIANITKASGVNSLGEFIESLPEYHDYEAAENQNGKSIQYKGRNFYWYKQTSYYDSSKKDLIILNQDKKIRIKFGPNFEEIKFTKKDNKRENSITLKLDPEIHRYKYTNLESNSMGQESNVDVEYNIIDGEFFVINPWNSQWTYNTKSRDESYRIGLDSFVKMEPSKGQVIVIGKNNKDETDLIHKLKVNSQGSITDYSVSNKNLLYEEEYEDFDNLPNNERMLNYPLESEYNVKNNSLSVKINPNVENILNEYASEQIIYPSLRYNDIQKIDRNFKDQLKDNIEIKFKLDGDHNIECIESINSDKNRFVKNDSNIREVLREYGKLDLVPNIESLTERLLSSNDSSYAESYYEDSYSTEYKNQDNRVVRKYEPLDIYTRPISLKMENEDEKNIEQIMNDLTYVSKNNLAYLQKLEALETLNTLMLSNEDGIYDLSNGNGVRYEKQGNHITCYDSDNNLSFEMRTEGNKEVYKIYHEGLDTISEKIEIKNNKGHKEYKAAFYNRRGEFMKNEDINKIILGKSNSKQLCDLLNINEDKYNEFIVREQKKLENLRDSVYSDFVL